MKCQIIIIGFNVQQRSYINPSPIVTRFDKQIVIGRCFSGRQTGYPIGGTVASL